MDRLEKILSRYDYEFPAAAVAQSPASPRDSAKLLVYHRTSGETCFDRFSGLAGHLPPGAVLVFNQTRVIPARLVLFKETGGRAVVLYIGLEKGLLRVMSDRRLNIGSVLRLARDLNFRVLRQDGKYYFLKPSFPPARVVAVLERYGLAPLPPYIKHPPLTESEIKEKYQSVFARRRGSVAAPTASLHFTRRLLRQLSRRGFTSRFVTLHVNLGTFAPLTAANLKTKSLHSEYYEIDPRTAAFLNEAKKAGRPIIAVGTTVVRALETAAGGGRRLRRLRGATDIFIREGDRLSFVDGLTTNFHVPRSSLMMLVAAFVGRERLLSLYRHAVKRRFRFFSFGDGMLIT
jgi:S-adenosylmethionine:tRNA ribosyltransferase-isomerase